MKGGKTIATTRIIPLHATKSKSVARSIGDILDYGKNPEKTDNGKLVSCYECDPALCNDQFLMKKQIYAEVTHKQETNNKRNVLAYQIRQSFSPDDKVTPEQANKIGMELARKFAGDDFQLVVCTHIDRTLTECTSIEDFKQKRLQARIYRKYGSLHNLSTTPTNNY